MNQQMQVRDELPPLSPADVRTQVNLIQTVMKQVMKDGQHYGTIPGCGDKKALFKSGAEKLAMTFRLRPVINNERDIVITDLGDGHREVNVYCHIMSLSGVELATGIGSCSTKESKYRYRGGEKKSIGKAVPKEYWNLRKEGNMKEALDMIGGDGFGVMKVDGNWEICEHGAKMENPDIADTYNTVLKMAKKRAQIDGILSATAASDIFTQDIEELEPEPNAEQKAAKPAVDKPEETTADPNKITQPQVKRLYALLNGAKYPEETFKMWLDGNYNLSSYSDITKADYEAICKHVQEYKR